MAAGFSPCARIEYILIVMAKYTSSSRYQLSATGQTATRKERQAVTYYQYLSRDGDTFERLAAQLFNDGTRFWEIADINPHVKFPGFIPTGTALRLPR